MWGILKLKCLVFRQLLQPFSTNMSTIQQTLIHVCLLDIGKHAHLGYCRCQMQTKMRKYVKYAFLQLFMNTVILFWYTCIFYYNILYKSSQHSTFYQMMEASLYDKIMDQQRLEPEFFRVGFYGKKFPFFLRVSCKIFLFHLKVIHLYSL